MGGKKLAFLPWNIYFICFAFSQREEKKKREKRLINLAKQQMQTDEEEPKEEQTEKDEGNQLGVIKEKTQILHFAFAASECEHLYL